MAKKEGSKKVKKESTEKAPKKVKASAGTKTTQKAERKRKTGVSVSQDFRSKAVELSQQIESGYMDLSEVMYTVREKEYFREWGHASFKDYADAELSMDGNKANALATIWDKMKSLNLKKEALERIGWTKARLLVRVADEENFEELVDAAETMTQTQFRERVVELSGGKSSRGRKQQGFTLKFDLGSSEGRIVQEALERAAKLFETKDTAIAFSSMCGQWLAESGQLDKTETSAKDICKVLGRIYNAVFTYEEKDEDLNETDEEETDEDETEDETEDEDEGAEEADEEEEEDA